MTQIKIKALTASLAAVIFAIAAAFAFEGSAIEAAAEEYYYNDFVYEITDDGTAKIIDYSGAGLYVSIPQTLGNYTVSEIGTATFMKNDSIKELTIPESVKKIGANAFYCCTSLQKVEICGSPDKIGNSAFSGCTLLNKVNLGETHSIGKYAFSDCISLESIEIPESVAEIDDYAFFNCISLSEIKIEDSLEKIGSYVFNDTLWFKECTDEFVVIGNGILLYYNGEDENVTVPDGVKIIGECVFKGNDSIVEVTFPNGLEIIDSSAFENCISLKTVNFSDTLTSIGNGSFKNCTALEEIKIPDSVTELGEYAFGGCTSLKNVNIPSSVKDINDYAFFECSSLDGINFEEGLETIGAFSFSGCERIQRLIFPKTLKLVGESAFSGCTSLTRVEFNGSVTIGNIAFGSCVNLEEMVFYTAPEELDENLFASNSISPKFVSDTPYIEEYASDNGFETDSIKNLEPYESKGIIQADDNSKKSVFSTEYTLIAAAIVIADLALVIIFSLYILSTVNRKKASRYKPAEKNTPNIQKSESNNFIPRNKYVPKHMSQQNTQGKTAPPNKNPRYKK